MLNYKTKDVLEENLTIPIFTAGKDQYPQIAVSKGILELGPISLETLEVPTFSKNLLSETQLAIEHECKQVIEPRTGKLIISKNKEIVATGSYDHSTKLIKIDDVNQATNLAKEKIGNSPQKVNNRLLSEIPIKPTPTSSKATTDDWITAHRKMGHVGAQMMTNPLKSTTGISLKNNFEILSCEVAKQLKQNGKEFQRNEMEIMNCWML